MGDLAQLNRLRVNSGKTELKSWKASKTALQEQIDKLLAAGVSDALPGAALNVVPQTDNPEIIEAMKPKEEPKDDEQNDEPKSLSESALGKMATPKSDKADKPAKKEKAKLARGLETDTMAVQSRAAVQSRRAKEKREEDEANKPKLTKKQRKKLKKMKKLAKLNEQDKAAIKDEATARKPKIAGEVDAKKEPEKAERQKKHIADKQKARAEKPVKEKDDKNFTVADLARELDIEPKVARAKLRRHEEKLQSLHTKGQDRWTFPNSAKAEVSKILSGKK